jgi:hypothetical protein
MKKISSLSKRSKLSGSVVKTILANELLYKEHYKKTELELIEVDFDLATLKRLNSIAKVLRVSLNAVVSGMLQDALKGGE